MSGRTVCTACPMLCDDVLVDHRGGGPGRSVTIERACEHGRRSIAAAFARRVAGDRAVAMIDGRTVARSEAIAAAAAMLDGGRRVLVTGLAAAPLEAQRLAAMLAERLGAAFDTGSPDGRLLTGPTIARAGQVTAEWEELRDRADLVVLWFTDPSASHPRFFERFLSPAPHGGRRTVISVGPVPPSIPNGLVLDDVLLEHLSMDGGGAAEFSRSLEGRLEAEPTLIDDPRLARLLAAFRAAACVAIVTGTHDDVGLERWSVARLVRQLAHRRPAFEITLGPGILAGGGNAAGAAAVATWRHGAAGAIARACDLGGRFEPAEADGERLVFRSEVDRVLVLGGLSASMERTLRDAAGRSHAGTWGVVWIGPDQDRVLPAPAGGVFLRCGEPLLDSDGGMVREDGRLVPVRPCVASDLPSIGMLLDDLLGALSGLSASSGTSVGPTAAIRLDGSGRPREVRP